MMIHVCIIIWRHRDAVRSDQENNHLNVVVTSGIGRAVCAVETIFGLETLQLGSNILVFCRQSDWQHTCCWFFSSWRSMALGLRICGRHASAHLPHLSADWCWHWPSQVRIQHYSQPTQGSACIEKQNETHYHHYHVQYMYVGVGLGAFHSCIINNNEGRPCGLHQVLICKS